MNRQHILNTPGATLREPIQSPFLQSPYSIKLNRNNHVEPQVEEIEKLIRQPEDHAANPAAGGGMRIPAASLPVILYSIT